MPRLRLLPRLCSAEGPVFTHELRKLSGTLVQGVLSGMSLFTRAGSFGKQSEGNVFARVGKYSRCAEKSTEQQHCAVGRLDAKSTVLSFYISKSMSCINFAAVNEGREFGDDSLRSNHPTNKSAFPPLIGCKSTRLHVWAVFLRPLAANTVFCLRRRSRHVVWCFKPGSYCAECNKNASKDRLR